MKRIDLHIHTFATKHDRRGFQFDQSVLQAYVERAKLDAIAVTNHNVFHDETYSAACDAVSIPVFPELKSM